MFLFKVVSVMVLIVPWTTTVVFGSTGTPPQTNSHTVNFIVSPSKETCFYQYYPGGETIMLEYKVTTATYQDHVIGFQLSDMRGRPLVTEFNKRSSWSQFKTTEDGSYRFCFDNTHTKYSKKTVFFRLKTIGGIDWETYNETDLASEGSYGGKAEEIVQLIDRVRFNLNGVQEVQRTYRQVELHDRRTAEDNFDRVNWYSMMCLACTITVMLIQVFSLRSFFDDKSAVQRFFKQRR